MIITLLCQAEAAQVPGLAREVGPGSTVLCASQPEAVATAQRVFPDRRIEVKTLYREPDLGPRFKGFQALALLSWMLLPSDSGEAAEEAKRRVVDTSIKLIDQAKQHQEAVIVAGPVLLRLLAFKLNAIGYQGSFITAFKPGERRSYAYQV